MPLRAASAHAAGASVALRMPAAHCRRAQWRGDRTVWTTTILPAPTSSSSRISAGTSPSMPSPRLPPLPALTVDCSWMDANRGPKLVMLPSVARCTARPPWPPFGASIPRRFVRRAVPPARCCLRVERARQPPARNGSPAWRRRLEFESAAAGSRWKRPHQRRSVRRSFARSALRAMVSSARRAENKNCMAFRLTKLRRVVPS